VSPEIPRTFFEAFPQFGQKREIEESIVLTNVDIKEINFSQSTIQDTFKDGKKIVVIQSIKSGQGTITDIPTIKVVNYNGVFYSLDNRRLFTMKEVLKGKRSQNRKINVQFVELNDLTEKQDKHPGQTYRDELNRKLTSKRPHQIRVKDGQPTWTPRQGRQGGKYIYDKQQRKVYLSQLSEKAKKELILKDPSLADVFKSPSGKSVTVSESGNQPSHEKSLERFQKLNPKDPSLKQERKKSMRRLSENKISEGESAKKPPSLESGVSRRRTEYVSDLHHDHTSRRSSSLSRASSRGMSTQIKHSPPSYNRASTPTPTYRRPSSPPQHLPPRYNSLDSYSHIPQTFISSAILASKT
jgi:hypothetical protein